MARNDRRTRALKTRTDAASATPPEHAVITKHGGDGERLTPAKIKREAARLLREAADLAGWRVPKDAPPAARELADFALVRIKDVAEGRVSFRLSPSVLRASQALRDEICGPIPTESKLTGGLTFMDFIVQVGKHANAQIAAGRERDAQSALPPASGVEGEP